MDYLQQNQQHQHLQQHLTPPPPPPGPPPSSQQMSYFQNDADFSPQTRARSNTWPACPRGLITQQDEENSQQGHPHHNNNNEMNEVEVEDTFNTEQQQEINTSQSNLLMQKKGTSRRNAWGNLSYADLITQAISSSPEKRLTLSQIYDWMVGNVGYFKDKGDSNSSAGWKNSIRHNLSLHNRFVRVQNEGTGKSSWWMLNPDAKPGKAARRRATSMETSKYEKKRGRIRKKIEQMRNGLIPDLENGGSLGSLNSLTGGGGQLGGGSPCSSLGEGLDIFPGGGGQNRGQGLLPLLPLGGSAAAGAGGNYSSLSPLSSVNNEFRQRASSNASSCGGRLSPILAANNESELWEYSNYYGGLQQQNNESSRFLAEQLAGSLQSGCKLSGSGDYYQIHSPQESTSNNTTATAQNNSDQQQQNSFNNGSSNSLLTNSSSSASSATRRILVGAQDPTITGVSSSATANSNLTNLSTTNHQLYFSSSDYNDALLLEQKFSAVNVSSPSTDYNFDQLSQFDVDLADEVLQNELIAEGLLMNGGDFIGGLPPLINTTSNNSSNNTPYLQHQHQQHNQQQQHHFNNQQLFNPVSTSSATTTSGNNSSSNNGSGGNVSNGGAAGQWVH